MISINDLINKRYKVTNVLGHGGMSDVFEARDIIFKRPVAIKIIKPEFAEKPENIIRFENEARFSSALNHPNVVKIFDYNTYDGLPYIVNEYVKGQTLRDSLDFKKRFACKEACNIMLQLCDAMIYVHSKGIIHRDIKPQNIYYDANGEIKLGDFGISFLLNSNFNVNENKRVMGTAQYLAPEIIRGKTPSFQSDIYAMGITFFEILTGKVPFEGSTPAEVAALQIKEDVPNPIKIIPDIPKEAGDIILKACKKDLTLRYKTVDEMKEDILKLYNNKKAMKKGRGFFARIFGFSVE
ncbi:MAG: protein kinase [Bacilli bacterium]